METKDITISGIGELIQHLYDSEVDFHLGWLWDGGMDYSLENNPYPLGTYDSDKVQLTGERDVVKVFQMVVEDVLKQFPNSGFTKWFNSLSHKQGDTK